MRKIIYNLKVTKNLYSHADDRAIVAEHENIPTKEILHAYAKYYMSEGRLAKDLIIEEIVKEYSYEDLVLQEKIDHRVKPKTRLLKVAKELNVGTPTIVNYLNGLGYVVENKPTAKISEEEYDLLIKEFGDEPNS